MAHPSADPVIDIDGLPFRLEGDLKAWRADLTCEKLERDLHLIHVELTSEELVTPAPLKLVWRHPLIDIRGAWHPGCNSKRWLTLPWDVTVQSQATKDAPVISLYNLAGMNRLSFACSDVLNHIESTASVHEETASLSCHLRFFAHPTAPLRRYHAILRIDHRNRSYWESLHDIQAWWALQPGISPSFVPDAARLPMYSTWYSFHQELTDTEVERQAQLAKEFGCEAVLIDDGWQTEDNNRGYVYCGDWEVCRQKFPNMKAHVDRLHQIGMRSLLWFSVPFVGFKSRAYSRFQGKFLFESESIQAAVLDPRYPEVREYLILLYEKAIREWGFDGLKLDFVDQFIPTEANYTNEATGQDISSVPVAVDRLLRDALARLAQIKSDILIEFRQPYVGPLMRNYGNLFRAADCPNDAICNRVRTIDLRLLAGSTPTHSDMLMWSSEESPESAALQFLNILFSVPQISINFGRIPETHQRMLRFWIGFWKDLREVLLDGVLEPFYPELSYPFVIAKKEEKWIGAFYADIVAPFSGRIPKELYIVNATHQPRVILEVDTDSGIYHVQERNVLGEIVDQRTQFLTPGVHCLKVTQSGLLHFDRVS